MAVLELTVDNYYMSPTNDMNDNILELDEYRPHEVSELICLKCLSRWIGVYPETLLLKDIECKCGSVGYVIKTGQSLIEE